MSFLINPYRFASADSLLTGLLAWWPLDEASGTRYDAHGSYDLTESAGVGSTTGVVGDAAAFAGSGAADCLYIDGAGSAALTPGSGDFTCCGWAKFGSGSDFASVIVGRSVNTDVRDGDWMLRRLNALESVELKMRNAADTATATTTPISITYDTYFFFCVEFDSSSTTIYLDVNNSGSPQSASVGSAVLANASSYLLMGDRYPTSPGSVELAGAIDNVAIWSRLLTSGEKASLYNSGSGMAYPG